MTPFRDAGWYVEYSKNPFVLLVLAELDNNMHTSYHISELLFWWRPHMVTDVAQIVWFWISLSSLLGLTAIFMFILNNPHRDSIMVTSAAIYGFIMCVTAFTTNHPLGGIVSAVLFIVMTSFAFYIDKRDERERQISNNPLDS